MRSLFTLQKMLLASYNGLRVTRPYDRRDVFPGPSSVGRVVGVIIGISKPCVNVAFGSGRAFRRGRVWRYVIERVVDEGVAVAGDPADFRVFFFQIIRYNE